MVDRRDEDDPWHTTGATPGAPVLRGRVILASFGAAPGYHEERHRRPPGLEECPGHRRGADLLGRSGQAHVSLPPLLHLCPGGPIPAESHRRLRLQSKQLVHVQVPVRKHPKSANAKRLAQEQLRRRRRGESFGLQEHHQ